MGGTGNGVEVRKSSIRLFFVTDDGQRHKKTLMVNGKAMQPTPKNIAAAERIAVAIREKIKHGFFSMTEYFPDDGAATVGRGLTVGDQLDTWLGAQRIEPSTKAGYESAIRFWKAAEVDGRKLGDRPLRAMRHSDILRALATKPNLTGKTVNNYVSVLREAMHLALLDKVIQANPVTDIPRAKHQKEPPDPFTVEEAEAIIAYMAKHYDAQVANYTEAKFFTGLRTSESFAVHWPSIDWRQGKMQVREATVRGHHKVRTKTATSRTVKLNSRALAALKRQKAHTFMLPDGWVFHDPRYGTPWTEERAFRRSYWTPALKALGIRYRPPYNTRHTYATMMLMAGMTPAYCAKQMGHSVEIFHSTYTKWIDGGRDDAEQARLEAFIAPATSIKKQQT